MICCFLRCIHVLLARASLALAMGNCAHALAVDPFSVVRVMEHQQALAAPHDIELSGDLAIIPGKGGSLAIIDVAKPAEPRMVWFQHDPQGLFEAETVLVDGTRLYVGTNDFLSLDISNPEKPKIDSRLADRPRISRINGMLKRGDWILAANKDGWIDAFNVADPARPRLVGALNVRDAHQIAYPHDIDWFDGHIVVADPQQFGRTGRDGKLAVFCVTDDAGQLLPVERWSLTGVLASKQLVGANRVKVAGHLAYVGGSRPAAHSYFVVVDVSDPRQPREAAAMQFSDVRGPNGLTIAGKVVFLAGGQTIEAIDVSNPTIPRKLAVQKLPDALPTADDNAHDLAYRDGYLFVTGQSDNRLVILRIEDESIRRLASGL